MAGLGCHVLGAGSIGLLTAWHLRHASIPVTLLLRRPASASHIRAAGSHIKLDFAGANITGWPDWLEGYPAGHAPQWDVDIELLSKGGQWTALNRDSLSNGHIHGSDHEPCSSSSNDTPGSSAGTRPASMSAVANGSLSDGHSQPPLPPISRLIVATKAADTVPALLSVLGRLSPDCQVLLLQNGILGVYQEVQRKVLSLPHAPPSISLAVGSVTHGAYLCSPNHVVHSGMGSIKLAPVDPSLSSLTHPGHQGAWDRLCAGAASAAEGAAGSQNPESAPESARANGMRAVSAVDMMGSCDSDPSAAHGLTASAGVAMSADAAVSLPVAEPAERATRDDTASTSGSSGMSLVQQLLRIRSLGAELVPDHTSLMQQVHMKLAVNCAVNPFTALLGCLNNAYSEDQHGQQLALAVCDELFELFGPELLCKASGKELADFVLQVASGTGKNRNSMLQDVLAGRPTEIDYLNGYVARWAEEQGRQAPVNSLLHRLVKARESLGRGLL